MAKRDVAEVWRLANEIVATIERWLLNHDGKQLHLQFKKADQLRLLKFRTWELRYKVTVSEILTLIVPILRSQIRLRKQAKALGIPVPTLTGNGAERILEDQILKYYPNDEHIAVWRAAERERQLQAEQLDDEDMPLAETPSLLNWRTPQLFITKYSRRIYRRRARGRAEASRRRRTSKPYRDNPWRM